MQTVTRIAELRELVTGWRLGRERIAFVPTMGNLHTGHASLMAAAHLHGRRVISSMFVNPLQFGPNEDFARLSAHARRGRGTCCESNTASMCCFARSRGHVSAGQQSAARRARAGARRTSCAARFVPGHFQGVATVVVKLLNLVQPDVAMFGEKDYPAAHGHPSRRAATCACRWRSSARRPCAPRTAWR